MKRHISLSLLAGVALLACDSQQQEQAALTEVKGYVATNLESLEAAAVALQTAAPAPTASGWGAQHASAIDAMKVQWKKARVAYERIEGAIAVLFPDLDISTDERYDGFIAEEADDYLFDDEGAVGIHAIERILWADAIPSYVLEFEQGLPNYRPAARPQNAQEATDFRDKLCAKLVADVRQMRTQFEPLALDTPAAYRGVIGSMEEQVEKVTLAATGEEESRYAQHTLADMRANVEGGLAIYSAFSPWIIAEGGVAEDEQIRAGFARLRAAYDAHPGDAIPTPPSTWSSLQPSAADLATPFGKLFQLVKNESDPDQATSTVKAMSDSAERLGIAALPEE